MENEKIVIIGGGIIGCSTAYMIKKLSPSSKVLLLEKGNDLAQECSFQNGGSLTYSFHLPWNGRSILFEALKINDIKYPFYSVSFHTLINPSFWLWSLRFFISSFLEIKERSEALYMLGKRTLELHSLFRSELISLKKGSHFDDYIGNDTGLIHLHNNLKKFNKSKKEGLLLNTNYEQRVYINSSKLSCVKAEPIFADYQHEIVGCVKNASELFAAHDSGKFTKNVADIARMRGVDIEYNAEIVSFELKDKKVVSLALKDGRKIAGDKFVLCSGVGTRYLGEILGWTPPIWPVKGYSLNMRTSKKFLNSVKLTDEYPFLISPLKGFYRLSGFCEFTSVEDKDVDEEKCKFIGDHVSSAFDIKDSEIDSFWACQRPVTTDDLPIIGRFPYLENVYINSGHGSKGCILSLGSAEILANIIMGNSPIISPEAFSPIRFIF